MSTSLPEGQGDFDTTISESEEEFDDMTKGMPKQTRKEQKAQEKELNWREIMQQPDDYIQAFVDANYQGGWQLHHLEIFEANPG